MSTATPQDRHAHWEQVYAAKAESEVSWFEESPAVSLALVEACGVGSSEAAIDIGGGASRLVDALLDGGFVDVTVLDLSENALAKAKARLGPRAPLVTWIAADVTRWEPQRSFSLWHDRAVFHFLTEPEDRAQYRETLMQALRPGGRAIIGTFAMDGPQRCSGLPVVRYDAKSLAGTLGPPFELIAARTHSHVTPAGKIQEFQFSVFDRR